MVALAVSEEGKMALVVQAVEAVEVVEAVQAQEDATRVPCVASTSCGQTTL